MLFRSGNKIKFNDSAASDDLKFEKALDGQTLEYVKVPNFGDEFDFDEVDVEGKIALVERGSIAFTEKEQNAYDAGAVGVIVYDNEGYQYSYDWYCKQIGKRFVGGCR